MNRETIIYSILLCITFLLPIQTLVAEDKIIFSGMVRDAITRESLPYATIQLEGKQRYSVVAGDNGDFHLPAVIPGSYTLKVSFIGYGRYQKTLDLQRSTHLTISLRSDNQLNEVIITATESKGIVTTSRIDRPAMAHLQPTSFTDLLELLPGGMSRDPDM